MINLSEPTKDSKYGKIVWLYNSFSAFESSGILYLYLGDYRIGELISGRRGLDKYHKGDFKLWIEKLRKKDLEKVAKFRGDIAELEKKCSFLEGLWKK